MTTVVLTTRLFERPGSGGELCTERLLQELESAGHDLLVVGRGVAPPDRAQRRHLSVAPAVEPFDSLSALRRVGLVLSALFGRQASTVHRLASAGAVRQVRRAISEQAVLGIDCLIVDHLHTFGWLDRSDVRLPARLVVMHNLESDGYGERADAADRIGRRFHAAIYRREARLLRSLEDEMLLDAAAVLCLSDADAVSLEARTQRTTQGPLIAVLPSYPLTGPAAAPPAEEGVKRIGMIGTWSWGPNGDGLNWILEHVLPLLPHRCQLVLAGDGLDGRTLPPRVLSLGRIDDARRLYDAVDVVAIASKGGSGVQEKAIEAIASGRPIVATRHAMRGLGPPWPGAVQTADEAAAFARLCAADTLPPATGPTVDDWTDDRRRRYGQVLANALALAAVVGQR
jgi:glycosyltransferase involved in cell wall biosynthesis